MSDDIACGDDAPATLLFPSPRLEDEQPPKPIARFHNYFLIAGIPVHAIGERWHARDAAALGFPTYPVPQDPKLVYSLRLEAEDSLIQTVSRAEYLRLAESRIPLRANLRSS